MALVFAINIIFFNTLVPYISKETVPQNKRKIKSCNLKLAKTKKECASKTHSFLCTPDENRTHIVGTGIRYSIH